MAVPVPVDPAGVISISPDRATPAGPYDQRVEIPRFLDELDRHGRLLAAAADRAGAAAPVPGCPGWQVGDLVRHTGGVHRWAAGIVAAASHQRPAGGSARHAPPADLPDEELLPWYAAGLQGLLDTLRAAPAGLDCWTFLAAPTPKAFWARRQAHETAIHRLDAELAAGVTPTGVSAEFAADGLDELFGFLSQRHGRLRTDASRTILIGATDLDRAWLVTTSTGPLVATDGTGRDGDADLTVRGPAAELYPLLWNRRDAAGLELDGDTRLLDRWRELATI